MKKEHLLIIRFSALGDVAMTVPVVYSLAMTYPKLRITFLSRSFARPLFEKLAPNVMFMEADLKFEYHGIKGLNALYRRLTAKNFTAVADFHNAFRSEYLRLRFNIDMFKVAHLDKHRAGKRLMVSPINTKLSPLPTLFDDYADVLAKLGYPIKWQFTSLFPNGKPSLQQLRIPEITQKNSEPWIGIAPFALHQAKIYPLEQMRQVIDLLAARYPNCRLFLFGRGEREDRIFPGWCQSVAQCLNVGEIISGLREELMLMSHLDAMISMDSANLHLASLVQVPVISVWGPSHPFMGMTGWKQEENRIVQADLPCRPCTISGNKSCPRGNLECMDRITPEMIVGRTVFEIEKAKRNKTENIS